MLIGIWDPSWHDTYIPNKSAVAFVGKQKKYSTAEIGQWLGALTALTYNLSVVSHTLLGLQL